MRRASLVHVDRVAAEFAIDPKTARHVVEPLPKLWIDGFATPFVARGDVELRLRLVAPASARRPAR